MSTGAFMGASLAVERIEASALPGDVRCRWGKNDDAEFQPIGEHPTFPGVDENRCQTYVCAFKSWISLS